MKLSLLKSLIFYFLNKSLIHVFANTHEREAAARVRSSISTLIPFHRAANATVLGVGKLPHMNRCLGLMDSVTQCHSCAVYWQLDQPLLKPPRTKQDSHSTSCWFLELWLMFTLCKTELPPLTLPPPPTNATCCCWHTCSWKKKKKRKQISLGEGERNTGAWREQEGLEGQQL